MSDISERCWYAGWMLDTEYALWSALQQGPMPWGHGEVTGEDIGRLRELSARAGGWVRWSDDPDRDEEFVPLSEWVELYREWESKRPSR